MTDIESSRAANDVKPKSAVMRWLVSVLLLVALAGTTVAALNWQQPIRALMERYTEGGSAQIDRGQSIDDSQSNPEVLQPTEGIVSEQISDLPERDEEPVGLPELKLDRDQEVPIIISGRDTLSDRDPIEAAILELQVALISIERSGDVTLAANSLQRAKANALSHGMSPNIIESLDKALVDVDSFRTQNLESIEERIDTLSTSIISMKLTESIGFSDVEPDTTLYVSEENDTESFWRDLGDGVSNIYRVRRIEDPIAPEMTSVGDAGVRLRLLLLLERARSDVRRYAFDSYRASLNEAITIVDSFKHVETEGTDSILTELLELVNLELSSPYNAIGVALEELMNETSAPFIDSEVPGS